MAYLIVNPNTIRESAERGDLVYPYSEWRPIADNFDQAIKVDTTQFIVHTMAGSRSASWQDLWSYANREGSSGEATETEPTWGLNFSGDCGQFMDPLIVAHSNSKANVRAVAVENQDNGYLADPGIADTPWSPEQIEQMAGILAWLNLHANPTINVPLQICTRWDGPGVGYHRMFAEWSGRGLNHTCPGKTRIGQFPTILPLAQRIVADSAHEEDEMTDEQWKELSGRLTEMITHLRYIRGGSRPGGGTYGTSGVQQIHRETRKMVALLQTISDATGTETGSQAVMEALAAIDADVDELSDHLGVPDA